MHPRMLPTSDTAGRIIHLWMDITRLMRKTMTLKPKSGVMNPLQMHGLMLIGEHAHITMKEVAQHMHVSSPSATAFIDRLVKLKWVVRETDVTNRKLVRLKLSAEGRKQLTQCMKDHSLVMHRLFSLLSHDDQGEFERILSNLKNALALNPPSK